MIVVSNSGPIISFARADHLELLRQVLQEIKIPEAVYEDIVIRGRSKPGAREVEQEGWIKKEIIKDPSKVDQLPFTLGLGEREAIILAEELKALLLIMVKARKLKQLNFTMPNKVGLLSEVTSAMAGAKVNINTITAYEMEKKAHFMLTTDGNAKAKRALAKLGVEKTAEDEVIKVMSPR